MKSNIRTNKRKTRRRGGSNLSAAPAVTAPAVVPIKNTAAPSAAPVVVAPVVVVAHRLWLAVLCATGNDQQSRL